MKYWIWEAEFKKLRIMDKEKKSIGTKTDKNFFKKKISQQFDDF